MSHVDPQRAAFELFKSLPRDEEIHMLNLIRLRDQAVYRADWTGPKGATGMEAYKLYGETSGPIFARVGGEIIWRGAPQVTLIGPADEAWDLAFIARYPTASAFLEMVTDATYQADAVPHRQAAVIDSRLVRHAPLKVGKGFG